MKDVKKFEEQLNTDGLGDGEVFEPFNLDEEREVGDFQDDGFYVRNEDAMDRDAWLDSEEGEFYFQQCIHKMFVYIDADND